MGLDEALDLAARAADPGTFAWIDVVAPSAADIDPIRVALDLPTLAVEDILHAHQRPKIETYDDILFLVVKCVTPSDGEEVFNIGEVQIMVRHGFVLTVGHGPTPAFDGARDAMEAKSSELSMRPLVALHAVLDQVTDGYQPVIDRVDTEVGGVEGEVFSAERSFPTERIYRLKRRVLELAHGLEPLEDLASQLSVSDAVWAIRELDDHFRDVQDHALRVNGRIELYRDQLTDALNANLALIGMLQNNDMRTISAWAAIVAVPTLLAGVWGMNFTHMPELDWVVSYPVALALMAFSAWVVFRVMKRSGWL